MAADSAKYLINSKECREKAVACGSPDHREQWLSLAKAWQALASVEQGFAVALRLGTIKVPEESKPYSLS